MTTRISATHESRRPCPECGISDRCTGCGGCECDCSCWDEATWSRYGRAIAAGLAGPGLDGAHL